MTRKVWAALLLGASACTMTAAAEAPASNTAAAANRPLWGAEDGRYLRRWLLLGPISVAQADEIAPIGTATTVAEPRAGVLQPFAGGSGVAWRQLGSYGDILDGFGAAGMKDGQAGLALAWVERPAAGDVKLLVGGNVRGAWINGAWAGGADNTRAFLVDGSEFRGRMNAGRNAVLLRVERVDRPVLLSLRVVEPGYVTDTTGDMAPYIASDADGVLRVQPGTRTRAGGKIHYEVIAPGGRVVADARLEWHQPLEAATASWSDGPYEVRVTGETRLEDTQYAHLPWFKGDVNAAAQRLLADAGAPDADDHLKMLGDMVRDRAGGDWRALHPPLMEYEELKLERAGATGGLRRSGFVRLAWTDQVDGSTQFCRAYLPADYGYGPAPALIFLHGYNPQNPPYVRWWSIADRHNGVADRNGVIVLEPMGRGNVDYRWMGEADVLRCLLEAQRRMKVDRERVYITGESMGGNGSWLLASRNPQVFAAAAPVYGGHDYRIGAYGYNYTNPQGNRPMERFVHEAHASFAGAEGLRNVPMYVLHGDADAAVPVEQSRHGVQLLQRWGYDVRYREVPGIGHEDLKARDEIARWLLTHRLDVAPREVRLRSYDLAGARAHWVKVLAWENPFEMIEAHAKVLSDGSMRVNTRNVAAIQLQALHEPKGTDPTTPLRVWWNGQLREALPDPKTWVIRLSAENFKPKELVKSPRREGRLTYFFGTPFAIVVGTTSKDPALRAGYAAKAEAMADIWERWQHVRPRVFRDVDLTADNRQRFSLLLLGGPADNSVSALLADRIPLSADSKSVTVDGRRFAATDAVGQAIYPNPLNPFTYVLLVAPTSAAGLRYWNPQQYWHALNGFPLNFWDWAIVDGRHVMQSSGLLPDRGWVAAGVFDMHWKRDDAFTVPGDPELRGRAPLRRAPAPEFKLPAAALDRLVGRYRIDPGQIGAGGFINVTRNGDTINASAPENGRDWPLEAESESDFAIVGLGTPVSFHLDAGNVTGLTYHYNGQEIAATRLR